MQVRQTATMFVKYYFHDELIKFFFLLPAKLKTISGTFQQQKQSPADDEEM